jgi:hypothetical protein
MTQNQNSARGWLASTDKNIYYLNLYRKTSLTPAKDSEVVLQR